MTAVVLIFVVSVPAGAKPPAEAQRVERLRPERVHVAAGEFNADVFRVSGTRIWRAAGLTILFVTHNVREAVRLGQRVLLMSSRPGRIVQILDMGLGIGQELAFVVDRQRDADHAQPAARQSRRG